MAAPSPDLRFRLPDTPRRTEWWIPVVVVALHLPLVFISMVRTVDSNPGTTSLLRFEPSGRLGGGEVVMMPFGAGTPTRSPGGAQLPTAGRAVPGGPPPAAVVPARAVPASDNRPQRAARPVTAAAPSVQAGGPDARRQIGPAFASGRLWVRPLPVSPQELAARMGVLTHDEKVDSAVTAIIQDYLDRLAAEESGRVQGPPSWTTSIGGQKVGVDSKWFYLGPIRVPTFLLALIPINVQANPTQADMNRRLNAMREDLFEAARRAANYADFKDAVGRLRDETQRQRDFDKAQRSTPDEPEGTR